MLTPFLFEPEHVAATDLSLQQQGGLLCVPNVFIHTLNVFLELLALPTQLLCLGIKD